MSRLTVSVVIPSYNAGVHLDEALDSALAQRRPADEIIVVDDGSTDGSADAARRRRVRLLRLAKNAGPAAARNVGVRAARSNCIAFLDADDIWHEGHLEVLISLFERAPAAGVAFTRARLAGAKGILNTPPGQPDVPFDALLPLLADNFLAQSATAVRRDVLLDAGGYNECERLAEDYRLWLSLARETQFIYADRVTADYRNHAAQASAHNPAVYLETWRARTEVLAPGWLSPNGPSRESVLAHLHHIYNADLHDLWMVRDRESFRAVLDAAPLLPGSEAIATRWRRLDGVPWVLWTRAVAPFTKLPRGLRVRLRQMLTTRTPTGTHASSDVL